VLLQRGCLENSRRRSSSVGSFIGSSAPRVGPRSQIKKLLLDLVCSDEGPGLSVEKPERVFEAFFTTKPHGTGTGLSISRRIIESHGGHLCSSANVERGATFCFTLPSNMIAVRPLFT
jgi:C4-dicarboxylate-specific signal transduction histidine kinase